MLFPQKFGPFHVQPTIYGEYGKQDNIVEIAETQFNHFVCNRRIISICIKDKKKAT